MHCTWLCEASIPVAAGPVIIQPLPADWANVDIWPTPVAYFESLNHEDFWNVHAKKYSDAIKVGPKIFGVRMLDVSNYTQVLEPLRDPDKDLLDLDPSMSPPDLSAANFENDRRMAARKIRNAAIQTKMAADARLALENKEVAACNKMMAEALVKKNAAIAAGLPLQNLRLTGLLQSICRYIPTHLRGVTTPIQSVMRKSEDISLIIDGKDNYVSIPWTSRCPRTPC